MASLQLPADLETWPARRVVERVLEEFPGRVALACSFQKEETVLLDMLFEAPQKEQQAWFIRHLGPEVNLGNIPPDEVIPLETLRLGLRSDTMSALLLGV